MYITLLLPIVAVCFGLSDAQLRVTINSGVVIGRNSTYEVSESDVQVIEYLGIPYAQEITNQSRFKPPIPVANWTELDATDYGPACPQDSSALSDSLKSGTTYDNFDSMRPLGQISEDCLYLNIYRPYDNTSDALKNLAVMVFFHGGEFVFGSGMGYAGNVLASLHSVVVVTINYRLGAFGFLSDGTDALPGNYGIMDQRMALKWIKDNIQAFGGDPNLVTIFGSGAGGSSVHLHTVIGRDDPLFTRAIVQSASYNDAVWTKETATGQYNALLTELRADGKIEDDGDVLGQLRQLTWREIQSALPSPWQPVISDLIPDQPRKMMKGENAKGIGILVGSNNLDANELVETLDLTNPDWYRDAVRDVTSMTSEFNNWTEDDVTRRMLSFSMYYEGAGRDIENSPQDFRSIPIGGIYTDQVFGTWAQEIAMGHSQSCSCNVYKYIFQRTQSDGIGSQFRGARHGEELPYIFGFMTQDSIFDNEDIQLSKDIMEMWTDFAKSGNLSSDLSQFQAYTSTNSCRATTVLDVAGALSEGIVQQEDLATSRNWNFWNHYYDTLGLSCSADSPPPDYDYDRDDDNDNGDEDCEEGVWSDAGVVMSNDTAGALLITFIVLTAVLLLAFLFSCHRYNKARRKVRKLLGDDASSVISNSSTRM